MNDCPICLECFDNENTIIFISCFHLMCIECSQEYVKSFHKCPICRCEYRDKYVDYTPRIDFYGRILSEFLISDEYKTIEEERIRKKERIEREEKERKERIERRERIEREERQIIERIEREKLERIERQNQERERIERQNQEREKRWKQEMLEREMLEMARKNEYYRFINMRLQVLKEKEEKGRKEKEEIAKKLEDELRNLNEKRIELFSKNAKLLDEYGIKTKKIDNNNIPNDDCHILCKEIKIEELTNQLLQVNIIPLNRMGNYDKYIHYLQKLLHNHNKKMGRIRKLEMINENEERQLMRKEDKFSEEEVELENFKKLMMERKNMRCNDVNIIQILEDMKYKNEILKMNKEAEKIRKELRSNKKQKEQKIYKKKEPLILVEKIKIKHVDEEKLLKKELKLERSKERKMSKYLNEK